ncbi:hypothetical protein EVAR_87783_1 [Eumeta japonica]|uniref:Uncharacterized protein n=1 Tax=Eumeta variegata TaxID=151549 RepID=A0A4C1X7I2_EUMVA|nr:hypothetical protein EVAR_87783_1 [Eumeta japonica]
MWNDLEASVVVIKTMRLLGGDLPSKPEILVNYNGQRYSKDTPLLTYHFTTTVSGGSSVAQNVSLELNSCHGRIDTWVSDLMLIEPLVPCLEVHIEPLLLDMDTSRSSLAPNPHRVSLRERVSSGPIGTRQHDDNP